ncbi:hypothetical protein ABB26_03160 [Stenotrophomonas humi]|uniref:Uncharacterized protein n=1 Tax=Stenotrophomonas humi TaxID=405444 RepID=A0A0R0C7B5_9GAMM|nr:hypothetical protein ABB26_03160 [Stenotrophomonas humi]
MKGLWALRVVANLCYQLSWGSQPDINLLPLPADLPRTKVADYLCEGMITIALLIAEFLSAGQPYTRGQNDRLA